MEFIENTPIWYQTKENQWLPGILVTNKTTKKLMIQSIEETSLSSTSLSLLSNENNPSNRGTKGGINSNNSNNNKGSNNSSSKNEGIPLICDEKNDNPIYYKRDNDSNSFPPISDMTSLKYLNEPEMLHCIRRRYLNNLIYTGVGPILIVVNPCQKLPIYGKELALHYYNANLSESRELGPHVYQLSNTAYQRMIVDKFNPDDRENQVILINGDSGAGMIHFL